MGLYFGFVVDFMTSHGRGVRGQAIITIWIIWIEWNHRIFKNQSPSGLYGLNGTTRFSKTTLESLNK
jgi:hypothetical protein